MANSIYIFTTNKIPTVVGGEGFKNVDAKALYQYPSSSTLVSDLLTGARFIKQAPSLMWNETTVAVSDFNEGLKLLVSTLPTLIQMMKGAGLPLDQRMLQNMQAALNRKKGRFILTEFSELSSLKSTKAKKVNKQNLVLTKESIKFAMEIKKAINQRKDKKRMQDFIKILEKYKKVNTRDMGLLGFMP